MLPPRWSHANPIDISGDADAPRYGAALEALLADPGNDAVLVMNVQTAVASSNEIAETVARVVQEDRKKRSLTPKPVIAAWIGADESISRTLDAAAIPNYPTRTTPCAVSCIWCTTARPSKRWRRFRRACRRSLHRTSRRRAASSKSRCSKVANGSIRSRFGVCWRPIRSGWFRHSRRKMPRRRSPRRPRSSPRARPWFSRSSRGTFPTNPTSAGSS